MCYVKLGSKTRVVLYVYDRLRMLFTPSARLDRRQTPTIRFQINVFLCETTS